MTETTHTSNLIPTKGGLVPSERSGHPGHGCHNSMLFYILKRVHFLKKVVWICDHSNTDNTQVFWLLLSNFLSPQQTDQSQVGQSNSQPKLVIFPALLNKENWGKCILGVVVSVIGCRLAAHQSTCGVVSDCICIIFRFSPTPFLHLSVFLKPRALLLLFLISSLYYWLGKWASSCST